MTYNNYPHRGNFADLVFNANYDYWDDFDKAAERFDYSNLTKKEKEALREWASFNGVSGGRADAPYIAMNFYVKHLLAGVPASRIKGVSRKHKKQVHTICSIMERYSKPILHAPLYRGMRTVPESFQGKAIGDIATLDSIIAISPNPGVVGGFGDSHGSVMVIRDAFGIVGRYQGENELLLAPGSQFVINEIYRADWRSYGDNVFENLTVFEVSMVANENKLDVIGKAKPWYYWK